MAFSTVFAMKPLVVKAKMGKTSGVYFVCCN